MMGNSDSFGEKVVKISSLDQFPKGHQKLLSREGEEREREGKRDASSWGKKGAFYRSPLFIVIGNMGGGARIPKVSESQKF
jgi:hypothetical protein